MIINMLCFIASLNNWIFTFCCCKPNTHPPTYPKYPPPPPKKRNKTKQNTNIQYFNNKYTQNLVEVGPLLFLLHILLRIHCDFTVNKKMIDIINHHQQMIELFGIFLFWVYCRLFCCSLCNGRRCTFMMLWSTEAL